VRIGTIFGIPDLLESTPAIIVAIIRRFTQYLGCSFSTVLFAKAACSVVERSRNQAGMNEENITT
jgi:hypothetical protein